MFSFSLDNRAGTLTANVTPSETSSLLVRPAPTGATPLVVDLDGTLVRSDLLIETALCEVLRIPRGVLDLVKALFRGKAALKERAAANIEFDPTTLPYDEVVLQEITEARREGRPVYLASAADQRVVKAVAEHLRLFDGYLASDGETNCAGQRKAELLAEAFGEGGFDYIGNDAADLSVWAKASQAITVRASASVSRKLATQQPRARHLPAERPSIRTWMRLFRVQQYAKNALVFVPLIAAHQLDARSIAVTVLAALSFCLCASAVYVLNDLVDVQADRSHPTKKARPLASGEIPLLQAIATVPFLLLLAFLLASSVSVQFLAVLLGYFALTNAYSFYLKRKMFVDVVTLAMLYTARIAGGAVAIGVELSQWLLAFSIFIFVTLALVKRYAELTTRLELQLCEPSNRNYKFGDLGIVASFAAASGYNAVTVLALYLSSPEVDQLYQRPHLLWLICPVLIYWISRVVLMAQRRSINDDPIVFATHDRNSLIAFAIIGLVVLAAA